MEVRHSKGFFSFGVTLDVEATQHTILLFFFFFWSVVYAAEVVSSRGNGWEAYACACYVG